MGGRGQKKLTIDNVKILKKWSKVVKLTTSANIAA
jgi:hypothetical protein